MRQTNESSSTSELLEELNDDSVTPKSQIDNISNEINQCDDGEQNITTDQSLSSTMNDFDEKECILCLKLIPKMNYETHVQSCLPATPNSYQPKTTNQLKHDVCFNCSSIINMNDGSGFLIPCRFHHLYCFQCLYKSMNEYLISKTTPTCHRIHCNYQLSRYDLACIPLTQRMYQKLLSLIQNQQRPQCPRCHFYIDFKNINDLDEHIEFCHPEDFLPCEYCHCPQKITLYEEHSQQCHHDQTGRQQKLVEFILSRTKYPFSVQQIEFFIETQKKTKKILNALNIVEQLAEFDDIFPMELPTHDCDICMESCLFDDIFVFGCDQSHKLCYQCYEKSCRNQMVTNKILTCALCSYQLQYGELKQLRISSEELDQFIQYQIQKTFDRCYASETRALIKCPNQQCSWAFEPNDPNERFHVICQLCQKEFCSLCNQQYHYRTDCQQLILITERWFFWCNSERGRYLTERAGQDTDYAARLDEYEREQAKNRQRNEELRHRYDTAVEDENYKSRNCRHCPNCNRVVERMEGCESMICGQDYHGGNIQSGCGEEFTWDEAEQYQASTVRKSTETINDLPRPESPLITHENITCDGCHEIVRGIRFDCVHCPSLIFCEKCEQRYTLAHSNENRNAGQQQHVFRLIMTPFDEIL
ncbi:unnamed protein product [Adineta steineri]|uniref:RBR-type E3 ubiquitin transferase n=1 Tax=Adineta steineri TaxID=433720 RepID=A0A813PYM6_9BILA|nr:unnamed protein product [Adineta steineri]CAF0795410.1 unnamed protein product [Adineta steineri]